MAAQQLLRIVLTAAVLTSRAASGQSAAPPKPIELIIAATTDIHGRIRGWDYYTDSAESGRGLSRVAGIFDSLRAAAPGRALFVDAGDFLQGNAVTYVASRPGWTGPNPVIAAMNALKYDAVVLGNHEFNYGLPFLDRTLAAATFPLLAANVRRIDGKRSWAPAAFFDRGGVRVAVIGVTTPWSMVWDKVTLNKKLQIDDIVTALHRAVKDARAAGAQVVVVVAHAGFDPAPGTDAVLPGVGAENPMSTVANEVPGIDLIVVGHSHREIADTTINGVLMVQPRNWATSVAVATLQVERNAPAAGRGRAGRGAPSWKVTAKHGVIVRAAGHAEDKAILDLSATAHAAARKYTGTTVGKTAVDWRSDSARTRDTPIIDFIGEVMRRTSGADVASTAVFSTRVRIPAGPVTVAQLAQLYPYDNFIRVVRMSGDMLKAYIEQSARYFKVTGAGDAMHAAPDPTVIGFNYEVLTGAEYTIDLTRPVGDRVVGLRVKGKALGPADSVNVALTSYRASGTGGYSMVPQAPLVRDHQAEIRQLLIDEITKRGDFKPADFFTESWKVVPPALVAEMQAAIDRQGDFEAVRRPATPPPTGPPTVSTAATTTTATTTGGRATTLRIISTNDFHGGLEARQDGTSGRRGGAGQLAAVIRRLQSECSGSCASVLVDGGDLFQGTPASNLAFGRPVIALYNALGYAAAAVGNHDFDWSQDTLRARMRDAKFNMLAANISDAAGKAVPWIRPDTMVERGGVKIGIIGLALLATPVTTMPSNVATLRFVPGGPIVAERARQLRARGAEIVIVVAHASFDCAESCRGELADVAQQAGGTVDAFVGGHSHNEASAMIGGVPLMRARSSGRAVAVVDLPMNRAERASVMPRVVYVQSDSVTAEAGIVRLVDAAVAPVRELVAKPIATNAVELRRAGPQHALGNLIADAQRAAGGTDVGVMNNGGIRATLAAGPVTFGALYEVQPFGNMLMRLTATGAALKAYLERIVRGPQPNAHVSGVVLRYDPERPPGDRIVELTVGGKPLDPNHTYTVTMSDFMATGGDGLAFAAQKGPVETGISDLDALITFVQSQPGAVIRADPIVRLAPVPK